MYFIDKTFSYYLVIIYIYMKSINIKNGKTINHTKKDKKNNHTRKKDKKINHTRKKDKKVYRKKGGTPYLRNMGKAVAALATSLLYNF